MSDYRMRLIVKIKVSYDKYLKWRDEFGEDSVTSIMHGRVSGLVDALGLLDEKDYSVYEILDLYEELAK